MSLEPCRKPRMIDTLKKIINKLWRRLNLIAVISDRAQKAESAYVELGIPMEAYYAGSIPKPSDIISELNKGKPTCSNMESCQVGTVDDDGNLRLTCANYSALGDSWLYEQGREQKRKESDLWCLTSMKEEVLYRAAERAKYRKSRSNSYV